MPMNTVPRFEVLPISANSALNNVFTKYTDVFGIKTYATDGVENSKLVHSSKILAEYLDNDENGIIDDQEVVESIVKNNASMAMFTCECELKSLDDGQIPGEEIRIQDLYNEEVHINGAANGLFDASLEEVLHLITDYGYAKVYPDALSVTSTSDLTNAMDVARGGNFQNVPDQYPTDAWYTYYDETSDYSTQASEYFYWGLTSYLGGQQFPGRKESIQEEWALNTPDLLKSKDVLFFDLITREELRLPTKLPDGNYTITQVEHNEPELINTNTDPKTIGRLYTAAFGRVPDEGGLKYWINVINDPLISYKDVAKDFIDSEEFSNIAAQESLNADFTKALYQNILSREPDSPGLGYWTNQLNSGLQDRADVLMGFADSPENVALYESLS